MSHASIKTFLNGINTGKFDTQKKRIYNFIKRNPEATIADIEFSSIGLKYSAITARLSELSDLGVIKVNGTLETKDGTFSKYVIVEDEAEQLKLFRSRETQKRTKHIVSLLKNFGHTLTENSIEVLKKEIA